MQIREKMSTKGPKLILTHSQSVRMLYKSILKLHRGLPSELKTLGDQYAKDEFHRHKDANKEHVQIFMIEWTNYAINLTKQLGIRGSHLSKPIGRAMSEKELSNFTEEQLRQLYALFEEASKPFDEKKS